MAVSNTENTAWHNIYRGKRVPMNDSGTKGAPFAVADDGDTNDSTGWSDGSVNKAMKVFNDLQDTSIVVDSLHLADYNAGKLDLCHIPNYLWGNAQYGYVGDAQNKSIGDGMGFRAYPTLTMKTTVYGTIGGGEWVFTVESELNSPYDYPLSYRSVNTNDPAEHPTGAWFPMIDGNGNGVPNCDGFFSIGGAGSHKYLNVEIMFEGPIYGSSLDVNHIEFINVDVVTTPTAPTGYTLIDITMVAELNIYDSTCLSWWQNKHDTGATLYICVDDNYLHNGATLATLNAGEWNDDSGEWGADGSPRYQVWVNESWDLGYVNSFLTHNGDLATDNQSIVDHDVSSTYITFQNIGVLTNC